MADVIDLIKLTEEEQKFLLTLRQREAELTAEAHGVRMQAAGFVSWKRFAGNLDGIWGVSEDCKALIRIVPQGETR